MLPKVVKQNGTHELFMNMYVVINGIIISITVPIQNHFNWLMLCSLILPIMYTVYQLRALCWASSLAILCLQTTEHMTST